MAKKIYPLGTKPLSQHSFLSSLNFYIRASLREARRKKVYFLLALVSTLIVVAATAVSQTVIAYTPLIFLKLSESSVGSIDASITPHRFLFEENNGLLNRTVLKPLNLNTTKIHSYIDPLFPGAMTSRYVLPVALKLNSTSNSSECVNTTVPPYDDCKSVPTTLVLQNTERETRLGMTPDDIKLPKEIPPGGIIIPYKLAQSAGIELGDTVLIQMDCFELLRDVCLQFNSKQTNDIDKIDDLAFDKDVPSYIPFKVWGIVANLNGKFPKSQSASAVITEYKYFFKLLAKYMPEVSATGWPAYPAFLDFLKKEDPQNYASNVLFNIDNRQEVYKNSDFDMIQSKLILFSSKISNALGVFPYDMKLPIYEYLKDLKYAGLFLGLALNIIIVILFLLSIILIYNILLVTVETKTFEFGVIRMIGLTKIGLAQLILVQALTFVIPGIIIGLAISIPLLKFVGLQLQDMLETNIPEFPTGTALIWSILLGLLIPLISSYYPMKEALGKNLDVTLDLVHSKTSAVQITVETTANKFPWLYVTFGLSSLVFGIAVYVLLPLALLSFNLGMLLTLFFLILLGFLVGLTLISLNFQHLTGKLITYIFFFWTNKSFRSIIINNLTAHKLRNRQTAIMYSLTLGFIILIVVTLRHQLASMSYQIEVKKGAQFELKVTDQVLNFTMLEQTLKTNLTDAVESYAWVTQDLVAFTANEQKIEISHKGQLYSLKAKIRGVSPTLFKTIQQDFLVLDEYNKRSALGLGEQLYTAQGMQSAVVGTAYKDKLGLSLDADNSLLVVFKNTTNKNSTTRRVEEFRLLASLDLAGGFTFSKHLPSEASKESSEEASEKLQDILVSLPTFMRLAGNKTSTFDKIPMERLLIKVKNNSDVNADKIYKQFSNLAQESYPGLEIFDLRDTKDSLETNQEAIGFIFTSVEIVAMILSMFSLISSMSTNIMDQTKEIAVLRAIGFTKFKVNLLYVCEAFVLIISSAIYGILIGTAVAWMLTTQAALFNELPVFFSFPLRDCGVIFIAAIVSAFLSSYVPAQRITKFSISKIIRLGG